MDKFMDYIEQVNKVWKKRGSFIMFIYIFGILHYFKFPGVDFIYVVIRENFIKFFGNDLLLGIYKFFEYLYSHIVPKYLILWIIFLLLYFFFKFLIAKKWQVECFDNKSFFKIGFSKILFNLLTFWWIIYKFIETIYTDKIHINKCIDIISMIIIGLIALLIAKDRIMN